MKRKINRAEMRDTVINLIDLGFTAPAVTYMTGRTSPMVYHHLNQAGRVKGGKIVRHPINEVTPGALAAMRKLFPDPDAPSLAMLALVKAGNGE